MVIYANLAAALKPTAIMNTHPKTVMLQLEAINSIS